MELLTNGISTLGFSIPIIAELFFFLDSIIYSVATAALNTFFELASLTANVTAYSNQIEYILNRLMMLAGVYALFRGAIMLINYIIDPNKMKNASKDGSSIVKNIVLAVVLLIACPIIFKQLGRFQGMILDQNVIPKLIYGSTGKNPDDYYMAEENSVTKQSKKFVNNVFLLFLSEKEGYGCENNRGWQCVSRTNVGNGEADILSLINTTSYFDYTPFISGIVGMVLIYYFTIFAIEIGTRILKLVILQVISPIPIIMSVDPSQKNKLGNFAKAYGILYIQIFLRILTLYLAFVVLSLITDPQDVINNGMINSQLLMAGDLGMYATILLYIGVFQGTKELPKLIEDALGIKMGNAPGQGFGSVLKGIVGGSAGLVGGAVAGGIAGGMAGGLRGAAGSALAGGLSGMIGAGMGAASSKNAAAGIKSAVASIGNSHKLGAKVAGAGGLIPYMRGGAENFLGGNKRDAATIKGYDDDIAAQDKLITGYNKEISNIKNNIGDKQELSSTRNTADQYRSRVEQALESGFARSGLNGRNASLQSYLQGDINYSDKLAQYQNHLNDSSYGGVNREAMLAYELDSIKMDEARLTGEYESAKDKYINDQLSAYHSNDLYKNDPRMPQQSVDAEVQQALDDYNEYVIEHGMEDRTIATAINNTSLVWNTVDDAKDINEADKIVIEREIENYKDNIKEQERYIENAEHEKQSIETKKSEFQKTPDFKRRNEREKEPVHRSRDRN